MSVDSTYDDSYNDHDEDTDECIANIARIYAYTATQLTQQSTRKTSTPH